MQLCWNIPETFYFYGIIWLLLFGAGIKEFTYDSNICLFGYHRIGYKIYLEFYGFLSHA
jgi:hypothetical protein